MNAKGKTTRTYAKHIAEINSLLCSPAASSFFKETLEWALRRDTVDSLNDIAVIQRILEERLDGILAA